MGPTWVIGGGGLLGSAVVDRLTRDGASLIHQPIHWAQPERIPSDFSAGIAQLLAAHRDAPDNENLAVIWCAGAGVPSSPQSVFDQEVTNFQAFLGRLSTLPSQVLMGLRMFYASSAGAVYAGVGAPPYDETSPVRPLAPYGDAKLAMEEALNRFSKSTGARVVAGRISNLYGPGQDLTKAQGLVSALLMGSLSRRPIQIYVSLDTIRDYLFVTDAADLAISCLEYLDAESPGSYRMKILCSGTGTTISALLGLTRLVVGRKPLIVQSASRLAKVQTRDLTMRSVVWSQLGHRTAVGMVDGLGRTYRDLLRRRTAGE